MPQHIDKSVYKETGTDIAYKDPFSAITVGVRKKLIFFSTLTILHNYFPIDLSKSHVLGIKFSSSSEPTLFGMLGFVVIYYTSLLVIYSVQEIKAWLAQANEMQYSQYKNSLHDIFLHHQNFHVVIKSATDQLKLNEEDNYEIENKCTDEEKNKELNVSLESFINIVRNLSVDNEKFKAEMEKSEKLLSKSYANYRAAILVQFIKVGGLEVLVPLTLSALALCFSYSGIKNVFNVVF